MLFDFLYMWLQAEKLTITNEMGHARDIFSFGVMAENLLEYLTEIGLQQNNSSQLVKLS